MIIVLHFLVTVAWLGMVGICPMILHDGESWGSAEEDLTGWGGAIGGVGCDVHCYGLVRNRCPFVAAVKFPFVFVEL